MSNITTPKFCVGQRVTLVRETVAWDAARCQCAIPAGEVTAVDASIQVQSMRLYYYRVLWQGATAWLPESDLAAVPVEVRPRRSREVERERTKR